MAGSVRVVRSDRRVSARRLDRIAHRLLRASTLCAIATVSPTGRPHVNTAYFSSSDALEIVWLSAPDSAHSRNVRANASAAIAVYDSTQTWGGADRGIQLFGRARELRGRAAVDAGRRYARRFGAMEDTLRTFRVYRFRPTRVKLFHERELGGGTFVTARVLRDGGLEWLRTERYR